MDSLNNGITTIRILFIILPILMGTVHCIWRKHAPTSAKVEYFLAYFLSIGVGLQNLIIGHLEINDGQLVANYLEWVNSPFVPELGKAHIAFGVMGILSFWYRGGWSSATAVGYGIYVMMVVIGHCRHFLLDSVHHQQIIAPLVLADFTMAVCLFTLLAMRQINKA